MTVDEFDAAADSVDGEPLRSQYTVVRRDDAGRLEAIPYHVAFEDEVRAAATLLREAATLAEDDGLRRYLELRATALETDEYRASDDAWMDMKTNTVDIVVGPIEVYDDKLFACKASHEGIVLIKDREWSGRLARYAELLPWLQAGSRSRGVSVRAAGLDADLNVYDAIYHAGHANARPTSSAINLPNDEAVALEKGTRRLQLKNVMRAKFDTIVTPNRRPACGRRPAAIPDVRRVVRDGDVPRGRPWPRHPSNHRRRRHRQRVPFASRRRRSRNRRPTSLACSCWLPRGLRASAASLRSSGTTSRTWPTCSGCCGTAAQAHTRSVPDRNWSSWSSTGAVLRDAVSGTYRIDPERVRSAVEKMAAMILTLQGDGDYAGVVTWYQSTTTAGNVRRGHRSNPGRGIPIDVIYEQGLEVLGLT